MSYTNPLQKAVNRYLYNGKELQDDLGLNLIDFGNRFYDPQAPHFTTIDRFAEKYYSLSPYSYAANNPINIIDINGDSLWISHRGNQVLYENGNLYNKNGTAYTGKGVKVDKNGNIKLSGFLKSSVNALNALAANGGQKVLSTLQSSKFNFTIEQSTGNGFYPDNINNALAAQNSDIGNKHPHQSGNVWAKGVPFDNIGSGGTIKWNPNKSAKITAYYPGGKIREIYANPTVTLGHELFHGDDSNSGLLDFRPVLGNTETGVSRKEGRAVFFGNTLRKRMNLGYYRANYSGGRSLLNNGSPIPISPPRLILPVNFVK